MDSRQYVGRLLLVASVIALPTMAQASGARQAVTARPGEMVLLRDVPVRPAYRPAPPGEALIADPSPRREVAAALGTPASGMDELGDDEFAGLGATPATTTVAVRGPTTVERVTHGALSGAVGRLGSNDGVLGGNQIGAAVSGPLGAVGSATGGIGDTVRGALAQFPLGRPGGGP